ncbi:PREDICTED: protein sel-1 homolog 3-like [Nanorana parkeri]|uniref:protein sel-1 homolog 3-like n=1 Tax=Nanorana parkeri TaxID=125878 RepID=UPI0008542E75|nr:PREDICTED: protein sel-1 homolog 3-like [Nanorana parkeri]
MAISAAAGGAFKLASSSVQGCGKNNESMTEGEDGISSDVLFLPSYEEEKCLYYGYTCIFSLEGLVTRYLQIDCEWKYYNLSALSERPPAYAQIKMGDLFYTPHVRRKRDIQAAVHMYTMAALQREPQGLYNLGILVEEGVSLPHSMLRKLGFNSSVCASNYTIVMELYRRCRDHEKEDSYVPCSLALLNIHLQYVWTFHGPLLKFSSVAAIAIVTALSLMTIFGRCQNAARRLQLSV